jgi:hypothetical protein
MESFENQEITPKGLYIERSDSALITIGMGEDMKKNLKDMRINKRMYFEDRITYLEQELKKATGQDFELTATESTLEIKPVFTTYQFEDKAMSVINRLLEIANQG